MPDLTCDDAQELFPEALDDDAARARVDAHTAGCGACREAWYELEDTIRALDAAASALPAPGALAAAVSRRIAEERRLRARRRWLVPAAAAASFLAGGLLVWALVAPGDPASPQDGAQPAAPEPQVAAQPAAPEPQAAAQPAAPEPQAAAPEPQAAAPEPQAAAPEPQAAAPEPQAAAQLAPEPAAEPEPEPAPRPEGHARETQFLERVLRLERELARGAPRVGPGGPRGPMRRAMHGWEALGLQGLERVIGRLQAEPLPPGPRSAEVRQRLLGTLDRLRLRSAR